MKDSGVPWIGMIPMDWNIVKLKQCADIYTGNSISDNEKDNYSNVEQGYPYISTKDIDLMSTKANYYNGMTIPLNSNFKIASKDSTLLCIEGGSAGKKLTYIDRDVAFVNKLCCIKSSILCNKYLHYYIFSDAFVSVFNLNINGLIGGVSQNLLKQFSITIPSSNEQQAIADFLDDKCAKVDRLVALQEEMIEELKSYKQSVITEVVTGKCRIDNGKCVPRDPEEMKDSGVEWARSIPLDWRIELGKRVLKLCKKQVVESDDVVTCFRDGEVTLRKIRREDGFTFADKEIGYQGIDCGDIAIHGMDGFAGAIGISDSRGKVSPVLNVCNPINEEIKSQYIVKYLRTLANNNVFLALSTGIRERSCDLRWAKISSLEFVLPQYKEQQILSDYLDKKCAEIDNLIEVKKRKIEELKEYKKSIIYEYVTGKKQLTIDN